MDHTFLEVIIVNSLIPFSSCSQVYGNFFQLNDAICFQDIPLICHHSTSVIYQRLLHVLARKTMQKDSALHEINQTGLGPQSCSVFSSAKQWSISHQWCTENAHPPHSGQCGVEDGNLQGLFSKGNDSFEQSPKE